MVDYEEFWTKLQLGKWRAEAIRKYFWKRSTIMTLELFVIVGYFSLQPILFPRNSNIDFLAPISTFIAIALTMLSVGMTFQGIFIQQAIKQEIITYYGIIEYQKAKTLVTFINKGEPTLVRNISLVALRDRNGFKSFLFSRLWGLPFFEILNCQTLFQGWDILQQGECRGIPQEPIKKAINEMETELRQTRDTESLYVSIIINDEDFDVTKPERSFARSVLGGCKLGNYSELTRYARGEMKEAPGLVGGVKTYLEFLKEDFERLQPGHGIKVKMVGEVPPSVVNVDYEIWKKLDSIEKLLSRIIGKRQKGEKSKRT